MKIQNFHVKVMLKRKNNFLKLFLISAGCFLFSFFSVQNAFAQPELYVFDKLYAKPIFLSKGRIYAAVEDLLPVLHFKKARQSKTLCAATEEYAGTLCPQEKLTALLYLNGKPVRYGLLFKKRKMFISLKVLADALHYLYEYNTETQIADLSSEIIVALPLHETSEKPTGEKKEEKKEKSKKEKEGPVKVQDLSKIFQYNTYEVWVSFNVVNTGKDPIKGVVATLQYLDGYGKPLVEKNFTVGTMTPGQKVEEKDYWLNPAHFYTVNTKVLLDWEGKEKE